MVKRSLRILVSYFFYFLFIADSCSFRSPLRALAAKLPRRSGSRAGFGASRPGEEQPPALPAPDSFSPERGRVSQPPLFSRRAPAAFFAFAIIIWAKRRGELCTRWITLTIAYLEPGFSPPSSLSPSFFLPAELRAGAPTAPWAWCRSDAVPSPGALLLRPVRVNSPELKRRINAEGSPKRLFPGALKPGTRWPGKPARLRGWVRGHGLSPGAAEAPLAVIRGGGGWPGADPDAAARVCADRCEQGPRFSQIPPSGCPRERAGSSEPSPRVRPPLRAIPAAARGGKKEKAVILGAQIELRGPNLRPRERPSGRSVHPPFPRGKSKHGRLRERSPATPASRPATAPAGWKGTKRCCAARHRLRDGGIAGVLRKIPGRSPAAHAIARWRLRMLPAPSMLIFASSSSSSRRRCGG